MTGNSYNKQNPKSKIQNPNKSGQVLLIIVMLLATAITIVLAVTFRSTTDTQLTKLEEDNQKSLAAAQAGIEEVLKTNSNLSNFSGLNIPAGFSGAANISSDTSQSFVTPIVQSDDQYTFYMTNYDPLAKSFGTNYFSGSIRLYLQSESNCPASEVTLITSAATDNIFKYLIDPCGLVQKDGTGNGIIGTSPGGVMPGQNLNFTYKSDSLALNNVRLLIVRNLGADSRIGVYSAAANLPVQGKTIVSQANSPSGVSKKIQLFQSYPQIPADFFVTSF